MHDTNTAGSGATCAPALGSGKGPSRKGWPEMGLMPFLSYLKLKAFPLCLGGGAAAAAGDHGGVAGGLGPGGLHELVLGLAGGPPRDHAGGGGSCANESTGLV